MKNRSKSMSLGSLRFGSGDRPVEYSLVFEQLQWVIDRQPQLEKTRIEDSYQFTKTFVVYGSFGGNQPSEPRRIYAPKQDADPRALGAFGRAASMLTRLQASAARQPGAQTSAHYSEKLRRSIDEMHRMASFFEESRTAEVIEKAMSASMFLKTAVVREELTAADRAISRAIDLGSDDYGAAVGHSEAALIGLHNLTFDLGEHVLDPLSPAGARIGP